MRADKFLYVAGPYRAPNKIKQAINIWKARCVSRALWSAGIPNICPHMNSAFIDDVDHLLLDFYKRAVYAPGCAGIVLVEGWENSEGTKAEIAVAKKHNRIVYTSVRNAIEKSGLGA